MNVRELIERLSREDPDAGVFLCNGEGQAAEITECSRVRFTDSVAVASDWSNMFEVME